MRLAMRHEKNGSLVNHRLVVLYAMLALAFGFVRLATIVGPGKALDWVVGYLISVVAVFGVSVGTVVLVAQEGGKGYDGWTERMYDDRFH